LGAARTSGDAARGRAIVYLLNSEGTIALDHPVGGELGVGEFWLHHPDQVNEVWAFISQEKCKRMPLTRR
jgi:hypothetical protein